MSERPYVPLTKSRRFFLAVSPLILLVAWLLSLALHSAPWLSALYGGVALGSFVYLLVGIVLGRDDVLRCMVCWRCGADLGKESHAAWCREQDTPEEGSD